MATETRSRTYGIGATHMGPNETLLEKMELVEPRKKLPVPNHLLDTKIYKKQVENSVVKAAPSVIHFGGFELGSVSTQRFELVNISGDVQRIHIIPPQSKYFNIRYSKVKCLVPGMSVSCSLDFIADEWRYYYDCVRVHSKGEENLIIPVHAYPVINISQFRQHLTFPDLPIGQSLTEILPLQSMSPVDFEFKLTIVQTSEAFSVSPLAGIVPANGEVDIEITFVPKQFSTYNMVIQLAVSQFNFQPITCSIMGSSSPGLALEKSKEKGAVTKKEVTRKVDHPLERVRSRRQMTSEAQKTATRAVESGPEFPHVEPSPFIEFNDLRFPVVMETPHAVAKVLLQEPGKLKTKELRDAILGRKSDSKATRQLKEAMFEKEARENAFEERQNQLRWQVRLGDNLMSLASKSAVLNDREDALTEYQSRRGDPIVSDELKRKSTHKQPTKTIRQANQVSDVSATFDTYNNDMWTLRHMTLGRFQQAAYKVIVRRRADRLIQLLRNNLLTPSRSVSKELKRHPSSSLERDDNFVANFTAERVTSVTFPTYVTPGFKDDIDVDALGLVKYLPTEVKVKSDIPYFDLKVPQYYTLMRYKPHDVQEASTSYVPPGLARPLRAGAEDEVITLPISEVLALIESPPPGNLFSRDQIPENVGTVPKITDRKSLLGEASQAEVTTALNAPLKPPPAFFRPIDYPPLHVFNPSPGLSTFLNPLPYAECDRDFHLCPLPRYIADDVTNPHMATQRNYLHRNDVIKGLMAWKQFPSPALSTFANTSLFSNIVLPQWNSYAGAHLVCEAPNLLTGLPKEDQECVIDDEHLEEDSSVNLTPEMVNAEFGVSEGTNNALFVIKDKTAEEESKLEATVKKSYEQFGKRMKARIESFNQLVTNSQLILK